MESNMGNTDFKEEGPNDTELLTGWQGTQP